MPTKPRPRRYKRGSAMPTTVAPPFPDALEAVAAWSSCFAFARPDGGRLLRESDAQDVRLFAVG